MKPRHPTPQELKLWRESNRFTRKKKVETEESFADLEGDKESPSSPRGRRLGGGGLSAGAPTSPPPHPNPAPRQGEREKAPPALASLPTREATKRLKSYPKIDATLDLHGLSKLEAYAQVQSFLKRQHKAGHRHILIITGKGRLGEGILRTELPHWLNEPALRPLISAYTHGKPEKGGNGVTHVILKTAKSS